MIESPTLSRKLKKFRMMAEIVRGKTDETAERDKESPSKSCEEVGNLS